MGRVLRGVTSHGWGKKGKASSGGGLEMAGILVVEDLVTMDIQLPGMDGLEAARIIKGGTGTSGIKIMVLTAYAMKGDREYFLEAGCDAYLSKPVNIEEMLSLIENLLNGME